MHTLTAIVQAAMVGVLTYGVLMMLSDGAEELGNRIVAAFKRKRIG